MGAGRCSEFVELIIDLVINNNLYNFLWAFVWWLDGYIPNWKIFTCVKVATEKHVVASASLSLNFDFLVFHIQ